MIGAEAGAKEEIMTAATTEHKRRHEGWRRPQAQGGEAPHRTAAAPEQVTAVEAARWLDDGGAAEERIDHESLRDVR